MKKRNLFLSICASLPILGLVLALSSGCESESVSQTDIQVTPAYSEITKGQSIALTASGWKNYRWSLQNEEIGLLSSHVGAQVVYTSIGGSKETQVVRVTADTPSEYGKDTTPSDGTNAPPRAVSSGIATGTARIRHR